MEKKKVLIQQIMQTNKCKQKKIIEIKMNEDTKKNKI